MNLTFKDIALPLAAKFGFRMIPIPRGGEKRPVWEGWPDLASNNPEGIEALQQQANNDKRFTEWDAGCVADPTIHCVLDADLPDLVDQIERETGQKIPTTFTVKSGGRGCPHLYFLPTARSNEAGNKSTGEFDFWVSRHHSVAPGSIHSSGRPYAISVDVPLVPIPDWLCDWIEKQDRKWRTETGDPNAAGYARIKQAYLKNLNVEDCFGLKDLQIPSGQHPTLVALMGLWHDGTRDFDELVELGKRFWDEYCVGRTYGTGGGEDEVERAARHALKKDPCLLTLPDGHPDLVSHSFGLTVFATETEYSAFMKDRLFEEFQAKAEVVAAKEKSATPGDIVYPLDVWEGTEYYDYAKLCTADNFTPPEFHIEALKTYVGAIAGNTLRISNDGAGRSPRFYTVLMAAPGIGKNTAIDDFLSQLLYARNETGLVVTNPDSLVWSAQHDLQNSKFRKIGVCRTKASSASGLSRYLPQEEGQKGKRTPQERLIFVYPELTEMFEKLGITGSGGAFMSALCDLYDGETFEVPALANQAPFGGSLLVSLLAGVQPQRWDEICGGDGIEGSGLDERFNLIPTTEMRTKASLENPDFSGFRHPFLDRVKSLDPAPYVVPAEKAAKQYMDEWFQSLQKRQENENPEDCVSRGRLNILAWRNALHYAWLTGKATVDVDAVSRGAKLSDYQLQVRMRYRPLFGKGDTAKAANAISRFLSKKPAGQPISLREINRGVGGNRLGPIFTSALNHLVAVQQLTQTSRDNTNGTKTILYSRRDED